MFQDVHVMIFVGFGFLMTFLRRHGYSSVGFNLMIAAFAAQWATITTGLFEFIGHTGDFKIPVSFSSLINADFAAAAVLITFGAMLGRVSPVQLLMIAFVECICFSGNNALNLYIFGAADVGGSMLIHTFGAYFGLAASVALYRKAAKNHPRNSNSYHSDLFAMIGTLFLWLFWPSFNSVLAMNSARYRAVVNTYYSLIGSVVASYFASALVTKGRKMDMVHVQNATLAGGVAVGAVADAVLYPWGAVLIGLGSGLVSVLGYRFLSPFMERYLWIQDTCGVHNLHGLPGVYSAVVSLFVAATASLFNYGSVTSLSEVYSKRFDSGMNEVRTPGVQAGFQMALLGSTLVISIGGGLIAGLIARTLGNVCKVHKDEFFDDKPFWELPDDADNYLPAEESTVMVTANSPAVRRGDLELEARSIKSPVLGTVEATARI